MRARVSMPGRATAAVVALLVVATIAARLPIATRLTLWEDEAGAARIFTAHGPVAALKGVYRTESTPPGWYMLAWLVHRTGAAVGTRAGVAALGSAKTVRVLSLLFSAVTTAVTVVLARRVLPLAAAALAGVWMTFGYELVDHGAEDRAYAMLVMMAVLFGAALEAAALQPSRRRLLALAAATAAGLYTHYFFGFTAAAGFLWLWTARHDRRVRLRVTAALAVGGAAFLPWVPGFLHQLHSRPHGYISRFDAVKLARIYSDIFAPSWGPLHGGAVARFGVLAVVLVGCAVLVRRGATLYATLATVPLVLGGASWAVGLRIWDTRNLIEVAPFAAIAVAAAAAAIPWRWPGALAIAALAALTLTFFVPIAQRQRTAWDRFDTDVARMGWRPDMPVVLFGRYTDTVAMSWYMPGNPRLHLGTVAPGCSTVFVVADDPVGKAWLRQHAGVVQREAAVPWYGRFEGRRVRGADLHVARLPWSVATASDAVAKGALLLHTGAVRGPVCGGR